MRRIVVLLFGTFASIALGLLAGQYISERKSLAATPLTIIQKRETPDSLGVSMDVTRTRRSDGSLAISTVKTYPPTLEENRRRYQNVLIFETTNKQVIEYHPKVNLKLSHPMGAKMIQQFEHIRTVSGPKNCGEDAKPDPELLTIFGYDVLRSTTERFREECGYLTEENGLTLDSKCVNEVWVAPELNCLQLRMRETRIDTRTGMIDQQAELLYTVAIEQRTRDDLFVVPANVDEGPPSELRRRMASLRGETSTDGDPNSVVRSKQRDDRYYKLRGEPTP